MLIELAEVRCRAARRRRSRKAAFDQALAVVEAAPDLDGVDIAAEGGELLLLQGADPSRGIEEMTPMLARL